MRHALLERFTDPGSVVRPSLGVDLDPAGVFTRIRATARRHHHLGGDEPAVELTASCVLRDFLDAAELRLQTRSERSGRSFVTVSSLKLRDGQVIPAGDGTAHTDNWQHRTDETNSAPALSTHLSWPNDGYFYRNHGHGYDTETGEAIIPLIQKPSAGIG
ncbi:hypothetical protein [Arthrobacter mobilis]|uniref:Uncharacterized protein n=1 Tax=Arthrobacter mobilis TaxID=2724944 RepID=A0A7X6HH74_9MICC|nr:hypothetical protein [Arthrobacter mobilis]NKX55971.1 hypothetical protein [Arthrobacter mobilis]